MPTDCRKLFSVLGCSSALSALTLIAHHKRMSAAQLGQALDLSISAATRCLQGLENQGLLISQKTGKSRIYCLVKCPRGDCVLKLINSPVTIKSKPKTKKGRSKYS